MRKSRRRDKLDVCSRLGPTRAEAQGHTRLVAALPQFSGDGQQFQEAIMWMEKKRSALSNEGGTRVKMMSRIPIMNSARRGRGPKEAPL